MNAVYRDKKADFVIHMMKNPSLSLLRLKEIGQLGMKIDMVARHISSVQQSESYMPISTEELLMSLKNEFQEDFSDVLGKTLNFEHEIVLKPRTTAEG